RVIEMSAYSVASLGYADAPFATDASLLSLVELARLLSFSLLHTLGAKKRTGDLCNSQLLRRRFVGGREKSGVAGRHARHHAEPLLMLFHRWDQQGRVRGPFIINLVGDDDLVFRLLNFDHFAELGGLARFSFADDFAGVLKQTDYLTRRVGKPSASPAFGPLLQQDLVDDVHQLRIVEPAVGVAHPAGLARAMPHPAATDGKESQPRGHGEPE